MTNLYHVFGLTIASAIPLPALPAPDSGRDIAPDVVILYGSTPAALANPRFRGARFQADAGEFLLRVDGVGCYHVQNGDKITIMPEEGAGEDDVLVFLMGSAVGALLHQRNTLALHAAAIQVNGGSVIFTGPSGIGKSTLAAGFYRRGYPFLADDVCAVTTSGGKPAVLTGFRHLKLWADILNKMEMDKGGLRKVRWGKDLEKYFLPVDDAIAAPVPVKSVFVLETTNTDRMELTALPASKKVDPIIDNTYRLRFLQGLGGKEDHFKQCAALAAKADVYRTTRPEKGFLLKEMMDLVEERFPS
jgi:hypothetical protein